MRRHDLQCLEHPDEEPVRPDALRRRSEWIRLYSKIPGENSSQSRKYAQSDQPSHNVPQQKIRKETHGPARLVIRRRTHSVQFNEYEMQGEECRCGRRKNGDVKG